MDEERSHRLTDSTSSGAGKSTLSKTIVANFPSYERLSIDKIVFDRHGLWGTDYPPERYEEFQDEACEYYEHRLLALLEEGKKDVVLDRSFYAREDRNYFKGIVEKKGGRWVLVFFRPTSKEVVWQRIVTRRKTGINADSALDITPELFDMYWDGFEIPEGEGEIVVDVV